jgi:hypothetical protein
MLLLLLLLYYGDAYVLREVRSHAIVPAPLPAVSMHAWHGSSCSWMCLLLLTRTEDGWPPALQQVQVPGHIHAPVDPLRQSTIGCEATCQHNDGIKGIGRVLQVCL